MSGNQYSEKRFIEWDKSQGARLSVDNSKNVFEKMNITVNPSKTTTRFRKKYTELVFKLI